MEESEIVGNCIVADRHRLLLHIIKSTVHFNYPIIFSKIFKISETDLSSPINRFPHELLKAVPHAGSFVQQVFAKPTACKIVASPPKGMLHGAKFFQFESRMRTRVF